MDERMRKVDIEISDDLFLALATAAHEAGETVNGIMVRAVIQKVHNLEMTELQKKLDLKEQNLIYYKNRTSELLKTTDYLSDSLSRWHSPKDYSWDLTRPKMTTRRLKKAYEFFRDTKSANDLPPTYPG